MSRSFLILLTLSILLLSACKSQKSGSTSSSAAPNLSGKGNNSCLIGRWPNNLLPLTIKISSEFNGDFFQIDEDVNGLNLLEQMAKNWNTPVAGGLTLLTVPFPAASITGRTTTSSFKDSEMGIYKSYTWFTNVSSTALAITQFYGTMANSAGLGDYISLSHADIILNYKDYGPQMTMTSNPTFKFDIPTIVLHEMGHFLGLCHEGSEPSVMQPYYLTSQRALLNFDKNIIEDLYMNSAISHLSAISNSKNAVTSKAVNPDLPPTGTEVTGVIELRANGECIHKVNGKEIYRHTTELK
jgi:hypothetical protein